MPDPEKLTAGWVESWENFLAQNLFPRVFLKSRDSIYLACNENYAIDHGLKASEISGRSDYDLYPRELAEKYRADDLRILESGQSETIEERYVKDGQEFYVQTIKSPFRNPSGEVIGILGTFWDISELKQTEKELRQSEEKYRALVEMSPDGIFLEDLHGRILESNRTGAEIYGYTEEELLELTIRDLVPEEFALTLSDPITEDTQGVYVERLSRRKDGSVFPSEISTRFSTIQGQTYLLVQVRDITERKRVEEKLRESEEKYRALVENANEAIIVTQDGTLKFANPRVSKLLGYSREEVVGRPFVELIHPEDRSQVAERYRKRLEGEVPAVVYPFRTIHKDGSIRWAEINSVRITWEGKPAIMSYLSDITERKQVEEALVHVAREWQTTFDAANDMIWLLDKEQRVVRANKTSERFLQRPCGELVGMHCWEIVHGTSESVPDCPTLRARKSLCRETMDLRIGNSWFVVTVDPILDMDGQYAGAVHIVRDITERKRAEENLRETRDYLEKLFRYANTPIIVWDPSLQIVRFNTAFERLTGYTAEEVIGKNLSVLFPSSSRTESLVQIEHARSGESWEIVEIPIQCKDSSIRLVLWNSANIYAEDGVTLQATIAQGTDITERKRAEEALRESEQKFHSLYLHMIEGAALHQLAYDDQGIPQDYVIIETNPAFERQLGISRDSVIGKTSREAYGVAEPPYLEIYAGVALTGESKTFETYFPPMAKYFSISAYCPYKGFFATIFEDITERKRAEEALQKREWDLKEAQRVGHLGSWDLNVVTGDLQWSDECYRIYGFKPQNFVPTYEKFRSIVHPEDLEVVQEQVDAALNNDKRYDVDFRFVQPNGEIGWIHCEGEVTRDAKGKPLRFFGTQIDITEQKRAEETLRESEQKHRAVVERAHEGIVILQDGFIRFSNPSLAAMIGYQTGEVEGMEFSRLIPAENLESVLERYRKRMAGEELSHVFETALLHKSGKRIPIEVNGGLIQHQGKPADLVIMRDISERKRLEGEMEKTRADFLFGVSHELKTPLFLMNISLEMLENSPEAGRAKRTAEFTETWKRNLHRLQHLVFNMVDSQRTQTMGFKIERQSTDYPALIERVVQENELLAEPKNVRITLDLAPIPPLWIDPEAVHRLVENLLTNAVKFSPRNGEVTLRLTQEETQAVLVVKDQGFGIPLEEQKDLFLPFQRAATTVRSVIPGTGLGLYVSRVIAEAHGGSVELESQVSQGTTITVRLPLGEPQEPK